MRAIPDSGSTISGSGGSARCPAACFPGRLAELDCGVLAWTGTALRFMRFPGHLRAGETQDGYRQGQSERFRGAGQG